MAMEPLNANILLVEDNLSNQRVARMMLEAMRCKVNIVSHGNDAIETLQRETDAPYDLILMDIGLPDINGMEITQMIREKSPEMAKIPVVAMTAHVTDQDIKNCFDAGMDDVLTKPIMQDELFNMIKRFLTRPQ